MNNQEYLLICLMEECSEIQKEISKILRFGLGDFNPHEEKQISNKERLENELSDLVAIIEMLETKCNIKLLTSKEAVNNKIKKVEYYMEYSKSKGII